MSETRVPPIYGVRPPCWQTSRLEERRAKQRAIRLEYQRRSDKPEDFIAYEESDSDEEPKSVQEEILQTSYSFVDYVKNREIDNRGKVSNRMGDFVSRRILAHEMLRESYINLGNINKVFCSKWLSERQVVFGTKCNQLMVYDVGTHKLDQIPLLESQEDQTIGTIDNTPIGIYTVQINPSRTLLATGTRNMCDIGVYHLPTLDPLCVGENAHKDWIFDICWLDDEFVVSGSKDSKLALWRITPDMYENRHEVLSYKSISALSTRDCRNAEKIRAIAFNEFCDEIAALSLNGYIHVWDAKLFKQKLSRKLPSSQENVCLAVQSSTGLYAVGCRSYTLLLDCRTLHTVKKISSRYSGCGIRSISFQDNILTVGTGLGMLMFYDLKAGKYLDSSINSSRTVVLKASKGYVFPDEEYVDNAQNVKYVPAIYTHCYDDSGTRIFTAGGPLPAGLTGNYAGLWQ